MDIVLQQEIRQFVVRYRMVLYTSDRFLTYNQIPTDAPIMTKVPPTTLTAITHPAEN